MLRQQHWVSATLNPAKPITVLAGFFRFVAEGGDQIHWALMTPEQRAYHEERVNRMARNVEHGRRVLAGLGRYCLPVREERYEPDPEEFDRCDDE